VSELDEELHERVKRAANGQTFHREDPSVVLGRARRLRRVYGMAGFLVALVTTAAVLGILIALLPLSDDGQKLNQPLAPPSEEMTFLSSAEVLVTLPGNWFVRDKRSLGITSPSVDFAAGSWRFPKGGGCSPSEAVAAERTNGLLLWLIEYRTPQHPSDFPARPPGFQLDQRSEALRCLGEKPYLIPFKDAGRYFQAMVALGFGTGPSQRALAQNILNSLVISPSESELPTVITVQGDHQPNGGCEYAISSSLSQGDPSISYDQLTEDTTTCIATFSRATTGQASEAGSTSGSPPASSSASAAPQ
jgi:hypothetical protein